MPKYSKTFKIITGSALAFVFIAIGGASVKAATTETKTNPMEALVTAIATKFNLKTADVQAVFNEHKGQMGAQMKAQHSAKVADRLSAAVAAGKLTQAQADLIKAKLAELEANRSTLTDAERKTAMKAWTTANNIPPELMMMGGHTGKRPHGPRGNK
ncbi:MAG: hypothetical protein RJB39_645 [Candidatus Parcubacteria bacterium]